ncbi:hypothetical protein C9374_006824 [Naegleria lovaniensis]|uniref:VWFA domain-containing protein n=1 Tax=Naegleria lovaniensis TaxID=51637 RepID=A0AA88KPL5_NAELO|nr:uncharacterized protein C9374_006824 [Naegleria lovaniensis]KAG2393293.1 hypothetical protein C9374_006824 [Naegleria lovaniensis]
MPEQITIGSTTTKTDSVGFNLSLLKGGTISQTIVGGIITALVLASTVATIILVSVGVGYSAPQPKDDIATTYKRVPIIVDVLLNDVDPRGGNLTLVDIAIQPQFGTAKIISKNSIVYQSLGSFSGNDTFSYVVSNQYLTTNATVTIQVLNRPPQAVPIQKDIPKNSQKNLIDIFSYIGDNGERISDIDNDMLHVVGYSDNQILSGGDNSKLGVVQVDTFSGFYYTPTKDFNGVEKFTYTISDGNDTSSSTITLSIANNRPVAMDDIFMVPKYSAQTLDLLNNDYDVNFDNITITKTYGVGYGGVNLQSDKKSVVYYTSSVMTTRYGDSFEYSISDGNAEESSAVVFVQVYNSPPQVISQTINIAKSTANNTIPVLYSDPDGKDLVTLKKVFPTLPQGAIKLIKTFDMRYLACCDYVNVEVNNYTLIFTPAPNTVYSTTFEITMNDGEADGVGQIVVNVVNTPPVAVEDTAVCGKNLNIYINVVENDHDPDSGDVLVLTTDKWNSSTQLGGSITKFNDTHVLYTAPNGLFNVSDVAFYRITDQSKASDGSPDPSSFATGKIVITIVNDPPIPMDDTLTIPKGKTSVLNILSNDLDPNDGLGSIRVIQNVDASSKKNILPSILKNQMNGNTDAVSYDAVNEEYVDSFTYSIVDQDGLQSVIKGVVNLNVVNTAAVAADDSYTTKWNTSVDCNVKSNDQDENGDLGVSTIEITTNPTYGSVVMIGNLVRYTPNPGYVGNDQFQYRLNDGSSANALSNIARVSISVTNQAPVTVSDTATTHWRNPIGILVTPLKNDNDPEGDALVVSGASADAATVGTVSLVDSQTVKFIPSSVKPISIGTKQFYYTAFDYNKQTTGTVNVIVTNTKPIPTDDTFTLHWSAPATVLDVLKNDNDANEDSLSVASVDVTSLSTKGSAVVTSGGASITYTPNKNGQQDKFRYSVNDGAQNSDVQATVTISFTNQDKPVASDVSMSIHWRALQTAGGYQEFEVLTNPTDSDGDTITLSVVSSSTCSKIGSNKVRVTVPSGFIGKTSCSFTLSDGLDSVTKQASVITFNTAPTCSDITVSFDPSKFSSGQEFAIASFVKDDDGNDVPYLTPTSPAGATGGDSLTVDTVDKTLVFKPTKTVGTRVMSYKVTDGVATSNACLFTVYVSSTSPSAYGKSVTVHWNSTNNMIDIFTGIPTSTFSKIYPGSTGTVTYNSGSKKILYTPKRAVGFDKFDVEVTDGFESNNVTVQVTIYNTVPTVTVPQATTTWSSSGIDIDLLVNYVDKDRTDGYETLGTITSVDTTGTQGLVSLKADQRNVRYVPQGTFTGLTQFKATATDGLATTVFTVSVLVTNTPPSTKTKNVVISWTQHKAGYTINVLNTNGQVDTDAENNPLTASLTSGVSPSNAGTVSMTTSPNVVVRAGSNVFIGTFTFTYSAFDGVASSIGTVRVTVTNNLPSATGTSQNVHWRATNVILDPIPSYASNYKDGDGDNLTITSASAQKGSARALVNTISYNATSSLGLDVVQYTVFDGAQYLSNANTVVNVNIYNTLPNGDTLNDSGKWTSVISTRLATACKDLDPLDAPHVVFNGGIASVVGGTTVVSGSTVSFTPNIPASSYVLSGNLYTATGNYKYTCYDGLQTGTGTVVVTVMNNAPTGTGNSVVIPRDYTKTAYDFTWSQMGSSFSDIDGDSVSIKASTVKSLSSGITVTTTSSGIRITPSPKTVSGTKLISFKLFDGLHESVSALIFNVTFTNTAPTCSGASFTLFKGESVNMLPTLNPLASDINKDTISITLSGTLPSTLGTLSGTSFTASSTRSGSSSALSFVASDSQLSTPCPITITVLNRPPVALNDTFPITASSNLVSTHTYSKFSDPDVADTVTVSKISDTCSGIATSVTVSSSGVVTFTRKSNIITGSCTLNVKVTDSDPVNPLSSNAFITIVMTSMSPIARNDRFQINQGQTIRIYVSQLLANDTDEFGTSSGCSFVSFSCPDSTYCHKTPRLINVNGQQAIEVDSDQQTCQADKFRYTMQTTLGAQRSADVFIEFKNCYCTAKIDFVFLLDSSGSIGGENFNSMRRFAKRITGRFKLGADAVQVGIVKFHDWETIELELTADGALINRTLDQMDYDSGATAQIAGLRAAVNVLSYGRPDAAKVIYVLTDGISNVPCSCGQCRREWETLPSVYPYSVGERIVNNRTLTAQERNLLLQDQCKYQFSDDDWSFSGKSCDYCGRDSWDSYCLPCSDAVPIAQKVNSWKRNSSGVVPNDPDNPFNGNNKVQWKIVSMAVGDAMSSSIGARQIQGMNYDPSRAITVSWSDLQSTMSEIVDQSCNQNNVQVGQ